MVKKLRVVWPTKACLYRIVLGAPSLTFTYTINTTIAANLYPHLHLTLFYMKASILESLEEDPHDLWYLVLVYSTLFYVLLW